MRVCFTSLNGQSDGDLTVSLTHVDDWDRRALLAHATAKDDLSRIEAAGPKVAFSCAPKSDRNWNESFQQV